MKLMSLDESKNEPDHPHYHVGAVCIEEAHLDELEAEVKQIANDAFGSHVLTAETELHAAELYHRKKRREDWDDFDCRVALLDGFVDVLSLEEVKPIDICINCDRLYGAQEGAEIGTHARDFPTLQNGTSDLQYRYSLGRGRERLQKVRWILLCLPRSWVFHHRGSLSSEA